MKQIAYTLNNEFEEHHWWYVGRRRLVFGLLERYLPAAPRRLLDFGCGTGYTTVSLGQYGEVWGADDSDSALEYCRARGLTRLIDAKAADLADAAPYHAILALDVLEHIDDDLAVLARFKEVLVDAGIVVLTVPAYNWLWGGEDYVSNHKRRYTRSQLRRLVDRAGFEVVRATYYNATLLPAIAATVLYRRWFVADGRMQSNLQPVAEGLNLVLRTIMASEAGVLRYVSFPFGASIACVAKKRATS